MPCEDDIKREWHKVATGSRYELSVTGPATFAAFAEYASSESPGVIVTAPAAEITPGPKVSPLTGGGMRAVYVFVTITAAAAIEIAVKAKVVNPAGKTHGAEYCRTIRGSNGHKEIIAHWIRMA
jgi:hypothetical protein